LAQGVRGVREFGCNECLSSRPGDADHATTEEKETERSKDDKGDKAEQRPPDAPAQTFLDWLTVISEGDLNPLTKTLSEMMPDNTGGSLSAEDVQRQLQAPASLSQDEVVAALAEELENPTSVSEWPQDPHRERHNDGLSDGCR
jgi:hypothetical protein